MKKRLSGKRARSRRIIMHSAKRLFEEKGIGHVTFNDIAEESEMCRTTIFNHFATINDLYYALIDEEVKDLVDPYKSGGKPGQDAIEELFQKLLEDTEKYPVLASKLLNNAMIRDDEAPAFQRIESIVWENLPDLPEHEKDDRVVMITGVYYALLNHYFINKKEFDAARMHETFCRLAAPYMC